MLVLQRKVGEKIILKSEGKLFGTIIIERIRGGAVKIAMDFPKEIHILREELEEREITEDQIIKDDDLILTPTGVHTFSTYKKEFNNGD